MLRTELRFPESAAARVFERLAAYACLDADISGVVGSSLCNKTNKLMK